MCTYYSKISIYLINKKFDLRKLKFFQYTSDVIEIGPSIFVPNNSAGTSSAGRFSTVEESHSTDQVCDDAGTSSVDRSSTVGQSHDPTDQVCDEDDAVLLDAVVQNENLGLCDPVDGKILHVLINF